MEGEEEAADTDSSNSVGSWGHTAGGSSCRRCTESGNLEEGARSPHYT